MKYLIAIKVEDETEIFSFDSEIERQDFIDNLAKFHLDVDYSTSEIEGDAA